MIITIIIIIIILLDPLVNHAYFIYTQWNALRLYNIIYVLDQPLGFIQCL